MRKTTHFHVHKQSFITRQDVFYVLALIAICLWFCFVPTYTFGQPTLGPIGRDSLPAFDSTPPLDSPIATTFEPTQVPVMQSVPDVSATAMPFAGSFAQPSASFAPHEPSASVATASPATANPFSPIQASPYQSVQMRSPHLETAVNLETTVNIDHPFRQYWGVPNDPQTKITGKPMTVAELFAGTRSSATRSQLLQAYWELSGLLAIYHFRCETERLASGTAGQQLDMMVLLREQRRTAEVEFIKQQWVLAELLKLYKGRTLRASELPIPVDYPLYPRYQTHANQIARTERTRHLGRMIPIQEQLIESKNGTWKAASEMIPSASQPFFTISNQRTMAFLDLTKAIVGYNKMIAEYALETIPPNVSQQQLVGTVVRLPKVNAMPEQPQTPQMATENIRLTQYEASAEITRQPVEQVAYEFQVEHLPASASVATPPPLPTPEFVEIEVSELTPVTPAFLMDL